MTGFLPAGHKTRPVSLEPTLITDEQRRRAQITVALHSHTVEDCALLLDMLGIGGIR